MRRLVILIPLSVLMFCGTAQAHHPALTLATADHFANRQAQQSFNDFLCDETGTDPNELCLATFEVDPCERLSPSSADCDVTYYYTDGAEFDTIVTVLSSRHNHILIRESDPSTTD